MMQRYRTKRKPYGRTRFDVAGMAARPAASARAAQMRVPAGVRLGIVLLALVAFLAFLTFQWFTGSAFRIQAEGVRVVNNAGVPVAQIIGASKLLGEHVLFADLDAAAARVDDLPGVDAVRITCDWYGDTSCSILVNVSKALAVWQTPDGFLWIDGGGKVQRAEGDVPSALKVRVESGDGPTVGSTVDRRVLRALVELKVAQPGVSPYLYSSQYGFMFVEPGGWRVRLGLADTDGDMGRKLALTRMVLKQVAQENTRVTGIVDVRFLEAPYYVRADR